MEDPFKRGWLFFWLLILPVVGMLTASYRVPVVKADAPRLIQPVPTPKAQEARITAVYATPTPTPTPTVIVTPRPTVAAPRPTVVLASYGGSHEDWMRAAGIASSDWPAVDYIVTRESGWNPNAINKSSGSCGLAQQLPCGKWAHIWNDPVGALIDATGYANARYGGWWPARYAWQRQGWW